MARGSVRRFERNVHRIHACGRRDLVGEAFDRKTLRDLAGRAQVRQLQRRVLDQMRDDADVVHRVRRIAVLRDRAGAGAVLLRNPRGLGRRAARAPLARRSAPTSRFPTRRCVRSRRARHGRRAAAAGLSDPSRVRRAASTARERAGRRSSTAAARRPRRDRRRWCRTIPSRRGRRRASSRAGCRRLSTGWREDRASPATRTRRLRCRPRARRRRRMTDRATRGSGTARSRLPTASSPRRACAAGGIAAIDDCPDRARAARCANSDRDPRAPAAPPSSLHVALSAVGRAHRGPLVLRDDREEVLDPHDAHVRNAAKRAIHPPRRALRRSPEAGRRGRAACRAA